MTRGLQLPKVRGSKLGSKKKILFEYDLVKKTNRGKGSLCRGMPNGPLVEYYMPLKEVEAAKKSGNHALFEKWREKDQKYRDTHKEEFEKDLETSQERYQSAWDTALSRLGMDERAAEASWKRISASLPITLEKLSLRSSAENVPTPQEPSTFTPGTSIPRSSASTITRRPSSDLETTISNPPK